MHAHAEGHDALVSPHNEILSYTHRKAHVHAHKHTKRTRMIYAQIQTPTILQQYSDKQFIIFIKYYLKFHIYKMHTRIHTHASVHIHINHEQRNAKTMIVYFALTS